MSIMLCLCSFVAFFQMSLVLFAKVASKDSSKSKASNEKRFVTMLNEGVLIIVVLCLEGIRILADVDISLYIFVHFAYVYVYLYILCVFLYIFLDDLQKKR